MEAVWFARGTHPYKQITHATTGWVVSLTNEVQRDVAQQKVLSYLNPSWIKGIKMREGKVEDLLHGVQPFELHIAVLEMKNILQRCDSGKYGSKAAFLPSRENIACPAFGRGAFRVLTRNASHLP